MSLTILNSINRITSDFEKGTSDFSSSYDNLGSIFDIANLGANTGDNDSQAKTNNLMKFLEKAMGVIENLANLQASAERKVEKNRKKAKEIEKDTKKTEAELNEALTNIGNEINTQSDLFNNKIGEMTEAQEKLNEKQEQINQIIAEIQEKQAKLAESTNPEEQNALLNEINALGISISELTASTEEIQEAFTNASEAVTEIYSNIETAKGNSIKVQNEGQAQIVESVSEASEATTSTVATEAKGVGYIEAGKALITSSTATSAIPVAGAAISTFTVEKANELISAGYTETTGSISTLQDLAQGIGRIKNNASLLNNFNTTIGSALNNFDGLVGSWNSIAEPLITSIGSLGINGTYATQANELIETVQKDKETLSNAQGNTTDTSSNKNNTEEGTASTTEVTAIQEGTNKNQLETPKFKFGL